MNHIDLAEPIAITIVEAARRASIGRSSLYQAINRGELPTRKCGRRTLILVEDLRTWVSALPAAKGTQNEA